MKRTRVIKVRLTDEELDSLTEKVQRTNFSREGFCRAVFKGAVIKEAPPAEYYEILRELRRTGSTLNQIMKKANAIGLMDVPMLRKAVEDNRKAERTLCRAFEQEA